jgi:hypothetical protein
MKPTYKEFVMKNKIRRVKQFVNDHNDAYFWTCGLITGVCGTYVVMRQSHSTAVLRLTMDQAKALMENAADSVVQYELPKQSIVLTITQ